MACSVEEQQYDFGAITANQAAGFTMDSGAQRLHWSRQAHVVSVLVDNQSEANLLLISDPSRPKILPGERKLIPCPRQCREVYLQADGTVTAGTVLATIGFCREGR